MNGDSIGELIDSLWQGRLVDPEVLQELATPAKAQASSARGLAADLVSRGVLTAFQAGECLAGRANRLALGPYRLLDVLGEGARGRVYLARHEPTGRTLAIKVLHPGTLSSPDQRHQFHREAEGATRLAHPNLVAVLDDGTHEGLDYLVMERVEGVPLRCFVAQRGPIEPARACRYARQVALALQHAYERRLVPNDLTASAILVAEEGDLVKLSIAGQGWLGASARGLGEFNLGSLLEPGPEAWDEVAGALEAEALRADAQGALRGLARVLEELLTEGGEPRPDDDPAKQTERAAVLLRMLAIDPRDAFNTPAECAEALAPFCDQTPPESSPPPAVPVPVPVETTEPLPESHSPAGPLSSRSASRSPLSLAFVFLMGATTGVGGMWVVWDHHDRLFAAQGRGVTPPPRIAAREAVRPAPVTQALEPEPVPSNPPSPTLVPQPRDYAGLIESSEEALRRNRVEEAIAQLGEAIRLKPEVAATYARRAEAHALLQEHDQVVSDSNRAIALDPSEGRAFRLRAAALVALGDDEGAIADATHAIERDEHDVHAYNLRGVSNFRLGRYRHALDDLNEAVFLDPEQAQAQGNLSRVLASSADPAFRNGPLAVKHATRACELTGWTDPVHLDDLAAAHAECHEYERAAQLESQAIEHAEGFPATLIDCYRSRKAHYVARQSDSQPDRHANRPPPPPAPGFRRVPGPATPPPPLPTYRSGVLSRRDARRVSTPRTIEIPRP